MQELIAQELLDKLPNLYDEEYKIALENNHDESSLSHIKGFCTIIGQILASYGGVTKVEMLDIKKPIIGNISLRRKEPTVDYNVPTCKRK